MPEDFQTETDLEILQRAKEIEKDPGRLSRAKNLAGEKADTLKDLAAKPKAPKPRFNGARR